MKLIVTCEHGGNRVPAAVAGAFRGSERLLATHRGYDAGALAAARALARRLGAPLFTTTWSRLVVDTNRSIGHPRLFSAPMWRTDAAAREDVLRRFYHPHRRRIETAVQQLVRRGDTVLHVAAHSFTPVRNGVSRKADVAWLYDPRRRLERLIVERWRDTLRELRPDLRLRRNYPYRGVSDGLTTHMRRCFSATRYAGIELELNQASLGAKLRRDVVSSLARVLREW